MKLTTVITLTLLVSTARAFNLSPPPLSLSSSSSVMLHLSVASTESVLEDDEQQQLMKIKTAKSELFTLLGGNKQAGYDKVLACPKDKSPIKLNYAERTKFGGLTNSRGGGVKVEIETETNAYRYRGRTDTYLNLLEPVTESSSSDINKNNLQTLLDNARVFVPPPLRSVLPNSDYIPMRDLFTSPAVSFAYERGWRQGFAAAGFPGADEEFDMAVEYFAPSCDYSSVVVDMSCATGLFTRRLAKSGRYGRVIGCDYSESMLLEARRRLQADSDDSINNLELVRLDVANIPMQSDSVNALHAGAAMHCWPEVEKGLSEIHRVLKPGGRYFATTFLSDYFRTVQVAEGSRTEPSLQAFNYFESKEALEDMVIGAGFDKEKVSVEVLGRACVVIRAEK